MDSLNEIENSHLSTTATCDGSIDCERRDRLDMDEQNRLAMLAKKDVLFDYIFGGCSRYKSKPLKCGYVPPAPFGEQNDSEAVDTHLLDSMAVGCDGNMNSQVDEMDSFG